MPEDEGLPVPPHVVYSLDEVAMLKFLLWSILLAIGPLRPAAVPRCLTASAAMQVGRYCCRGWRIRAPHRHHPVPRTGPGWVAVDLDISEGPRACMVNSFASSGGGSPRVTGPSTNAPARETRPKLGGLRRSFARDGIQRGSNTAASATGDLASGEEGQVLAPPSPLHVGSLLRQLVVDHPHRRLDPGRIVGWIPRG